MCIEYKLNILKIGHLAFKNILRKCVLILFNFIYYYRCPILMVTGSKSSFNGSVQSLFDRMRTVLDKKIVDYLEVDGVANVLEEKVK